MYAKVTSLFAGFQHALLHSIATVDGLMELTKLLEKAFMAFRSRRQELFFSVGSIKFQKLTEFLVQNLHRFYVASESPCPHVVILVIAVLIFWYTIAWVLEGKQRIS